MEHDTGDGSLIMCGISMKNWLRQDLKREWRNEFNRSLKRILEQKKDSRENC